jgi:ZIP family zinc transporter
VLILLLAASATTLATGLGAIPVFFLRGHATAWQPLLWGLAAGVMVVAAIVGLLKPALDEGSGLAVAVGLGAGITFLILARAL